MTGITHDEPMFDDDQIRDLARSVEPHDFDRIAPPPMVWNNIIAEVEVETASSEADARRNAGVANGVTSLESRRTRGWFQKSSTSLLAIAAATLLMVGVVAAVVARNDEPPMEFASALMTDAELPVPTSETAQARVICDDDICLSLIHI